ncbi:MAG: methyltransferase domain-containing protein [Phycisphaerales bacterium JB037]
MDRFDCYEACVQSPGALVPFLLGLHGGQPTRLGEDFCGSAALSAAWVASADARTAIGIDLDAPTIDHARARAARRLTSDQLARLDLRVGDVRTAPDDPRDLIFVGNFSIGEIHTRPELLGYLRSVRARLAPGGVFISDTYGGESAFVAGHVHRHHSARDPELGSVRIRYTWEQRSANPLTARVVNALHFRVERGGEILDELPDAFVYDWRLWSVPELDDLLREAGFASVEVHAKLPDPTAEQIERPRPVTDPAELDDSFIVCVLGRL